MPGIGMNYILAFALFAFASGKTYERCELAKELKDRFGVPIEQVATWVCIAEHESQYNTSAVGMVNGDYSNDHGIFQINDEFWCSPPGKGYACGLTCAELEDDDIEDDFACVRKIFDEHKILSGDGFNAWAVYKPYCKTSKVSKYIDGCFSSTSDLPHPKKKIPTKKVYPWLVPRPSPASSLNEIVSKPFNQKVIDENSGTTTISTLITETEEDVRRLGKFPSSFGTPFSITSTRASPVVIRVVSAAKPTETRVKDFPDFVKIPTEHARFATSSSFTPIGGTVASTRSTFPPSKVLTEFGKTFPISSGSGIDSPRSPFPDSSLTISTDRFTKSAISKTAFFDEALPTLNRGIPIEHYQQRESSFRINGKVWL